MALLMAMVVLAAGATTLLFNALDPVAHKQNQSRKTAEALAEAKGVLIGWAVSNPDIPGALPYPDRNDDPSGYDGRGDCPLVFTSPSNSHFLGRLPWKAHDGPACLGEHVGMMELRDGAGEPLWYAVSQKLLRTGSTASQWVEPAVDWSDTDNQVPPWITVRDQSGTVISDRIAAVVIAPGAALPAQDRSGDAPDVENYLDSAVIDGVTYSNADFDQDFVAYVDTESDPEATPTFNDRLVYITADELIPLLERRVLKEVEVALSAYRQAGWNSAGNYYPWLSPFADPKTSTFDGEVGRREGHLPIHLPGETFGTAFTIDWDIAYAELSAGEAFNTIPDQALQQGHQPAAGTCRWTDAASVDCAGTATESLSLPSGEQVTRTYIFDVHYDGVLTVSPPDEGATRTRGVATSGPLPAQTLESITIEDSVGPSEDSIRRTLTIDEGTTGTITVSGINYDLDPNIPELPAWFLGNGWHRVVYVAYAQAYQPGMSGSCVPGQDCLTLTNALVTPSDDKKVLLVSAGLELSNQDRDTGSPDSYYENENVNGVPSDDVFERGSPSADFNDQVRVILSP